MKLLVNLKTYSLIKIKTSLLTLVLYVNEIFLYFLGLLPSKSWLTNFYYYVDERFPKFT